ncbi:MAG: alpha/beta hydrolase [Planctomycetes bacterium]|nr:alpha/beta hydrolase [Planctomycetota bacterium]
MSLSPPAVRWLDDPIVYQPARYPSGNWSPENLKFEDVFLEAADGTRLHGWFCPNESARAVVLVLHGNAGNLSHRQERMRLLQQRLGVTAMIFDYRGYGRSEGLPTEAGVLDDARAARRWLAKKTDIEEWQVVLMGESLGGGVAVDLAAQDGAAGLVLESTFTSLPDVAARQLPYTLAPYLMRNQFQSLEKIGNYRGPLLMAHGDQDSLVPLEQAHRLFAAAHEPKRLMTIPDAGHNWRPTPEYIQALDEFFSLVKRGAAPQRPAENSSSAIPAAAGSIAF